MPATWDESRVLQSSFEQSITTARRSGDIRFVASVNNQEERSVELSLDFLTEGKTYEATLYQDAENSHGIKNPESYTITKKTVEKGDSITAKMGVGGGHAFSLRPIE